MNMDILDQALAAPEAPATPAPEAPQVTDLDGLSEFTYQGKKYTPDQLHQIVSGYDRLTVYEKEQKKFEDFEKNLEIDLDNVSQDPRLADKFKQIYPQKYHYLVDKYLKTTRQPEAQPALTALPREFTDRLTRAEQLIQAQEQRAYQAEVQSANAKLDSMLPPLFKKYPMAVENEVYARAEGVLQSKQLLTEKVWERLTRESHDAATKRSDQFYAEKLKNQLEKGQRGSDTGAGGGTPGQAPVQPKNLYEAREAMLAHVAQQKNG